MSQDSRLEQFSVELEARVARRIENTPAPGLSVGLVRGRDLALYRSFGFADISDQTPPDQKTISRVASITKTFTATAILQLRDAGTLALDDPLLIHIPEFTIARARAGTLEAVTIKRLLTHHSGLTTEHPSVDWDAPGYPAMRDMLDTMDRVEVAIPQDSAWKYSNLAYSLLGEVISRLTGGPYVDYISREIIQPLGMTGTAFELSDEQAALKAQGYSPPAPGESEFRIAPNEPLRGLESAGQLHSNTVDLARWISFHIGAFDGDVPGVLGDLTRSEMHRPAYIDPAWSAGQCLGWRAQRVKDRVFLNHGGGIHGFSSSILFNVPARTGVIVLANVWPLTWPFELSLELCDLAIDMLGDAAGEPAGPSSDAAATPAAAGLDQYAGRYWSEPGMPVTVEASGGRLRFKDPAPGENPLHAPADLETGDGEDKFFVLSGRAAGERAAFHRNEAGEIISFRLGGFLYRKTD